MHPVAATKTWDALDIPPSCSSLRLNQSQIPSWLLSKLSCPLHSNNHYAHHAFRCSSCPVCMIAVTSPPSLPASRLISQESMLFTVTRRRYLKEKSDLFFSPLLKILSSPPESFKTKFKFLNLRGKVFHKFSPFYLFRLTLVSLNISFILAIPKW